MPNFKLELTVRTETKENAAEILACLAVILVGGAIPVDHEIVTLVLGAPDEPLMPNPELDVALEEASRAIDRAFESKDA
jgi:hypothetical protein